MTILLLKRECQRKAISLNGKSGKNRTEGAMSGIIGEGEPEEN